MSDEHPVGYFFNPKVLVIIFFTSIFLAVIVTVIVKFMARWKYMPVFVVLVAAAGCVAEAFWMNYRNWYKE
jgi:hypothetical protein